MPTRRTDLRRAIALLASVALIAAAPLAADARTVAKPPAPRVTVDRVGALTTTDGALEAGVSVLLPKAVAYMTVRSRLYTSDDRLVYQKTQERLAPAAGSQSFTFAQDLAGFGVKEGRHRLEFQVRATGLSPATVSETVYVVRPDRRPVPVAVIVRVATSVPYDAGASVVAPGADPTIDEAGRLAELAALRPDMHLTAVVAPLTIEQWVRASGAGGAYAAALDALSGALASGALSTLRVPYADPDPALLERAGALGDLTLQLAAGSLVTSAPAPSVPATGAAVAGDHISTAALPALARAGARYVLLDGTAVRTRGGGKDTTASPGAWAVQDTTMTALVIDSEASSLLGAGQSQRGALLDHLFARFTSKTSSRPVVASVRVGAGSAASVTELQAALALLARTGWVTLVDAATAAGGAKAGTVVLPATLPAPAGATQAYLSTLASARARTFALAAAAGSTPDATACVADVLTAESSAFTCPSAEPTAGAAIDRGMAYARSADARAWAVLSAVSMAIPTNVTLSGSSGRVPVSLINHTGRPLSLTLHLRPRHLSLPRGRQMKVTVPPGETIVSVPVDVGSSVTGGLRFELDAGRLPLATGACDVRASFIDRFAVVAGVVLVLLGLLWYIRRRGRGALQRISAVMDRR